MSIEFDQEKYKLDPNRWVNTLPGKNVINTSTSTSTNSTKKYVLTIIVFVIGLALVSVVKNKTRNLQKEISNLKASINVLKLDLHQTTLEREVITSPENISRLAQEYLESDFISYKKSQIKQLNKQVKDLSKLDEKKDKTNFKKKSKTRSGEIKLRVAKKIATTKTELRKLQELYSSPEQLPGVVRLQVAKKIKNKKKELKKFYSDPYSVIKSAKAQRWIGLQVVKVFLGIPIVPGK